MWYMTDDFDVLSVRIVYIYCDDVVYGPVGCFLCCVRRLKKSWLTPSNCCLHWENSLSNSACAACKLANKSIHRQDTHTQHTYIRTYIQYTIGLYTVRVMCEMLIKYVIQLSTSTWRRLTDCWILCHSFSLQRNTRGGGGVGAGEGGGGGGGQEEERGRQEEEEEQEEKEEAERDKGQTKSIMRKKKGEQQRRIAEEEPYLTVVLRSPKYMNPLPWG